MGSVIVSIRRRRRWWWCVALLVVVSTARVNAEEPQSPRQLIRPSLGKLLRPPILASWQHDGLNPILRVEDLPVRLLL